MALGLYVTPYAAVTWRRSHRAGPHRRISLRLAMRAQNPTALSDRLAEISGITSPDYGQYLTPKEIQDLVQPSEAAIAAMESLFAKHNITGEARRTGHGEYYTLELSVEAAEVLFETELHVYQRPYRHHDHHQYNDPAIEASRDSKMDMDEIVRPLNPRSFKIPSHIASHVYLVDGLEHFPSSFRRQSMTSRHGITTAMTDDNKG